MPDRIAPGPDDVRVRPADAGRDEAALRRLDRAGWTTSTSPAPRPPDDAPFFDGRTDPGDVLVAEVDGEVAGYVRLEQATPLPSSRRVQAITGLAVAEPLRGRGVGGALVEAAIAEARRRGALKVTLRVLAHNHDARRLYARAGFTVEGVLREEFVLDGEPVDDLLLARFVGDAPIDPRSAGVEAEHDVPSEPEAVDVDPIAWAYRWLGEAEAAGERQPTATTLATVDGSGRPSARVVLIRTRQDDGFAFFTNRDSAKGRDLAADDRAAMTCVWHTLHRQLRVEGRVRVADDALSDAYWEGRPPGSRTSAAASPQSREVPSRRWLEDEVARLREEHGPDGPPRPEHWGGYVLVPDAIEFWTGRRDRLHDRTRFERRDDGSWCAARLAP